MVMFIIWMNNVCVGILICQVNGVYSFCYDEEWLCSLCVRLFFFLLLLQYGNIIVDVVYYYFDNLLFDSLQVCDWIVRCYQVCLKQLFDLLVEVGWDSVGVVIFLLLGEEVYLEGLCWQMLDEVQFIVLLIVYQLDIFFGMIISQDDFCILVVGVQEKMVLLWMGEQWCILQGVMLIMYIIKLFIGEIKQFNVMLDLCESVDNEYLCLVLVRELGLVVLEVEIIIILWICVLVVICFDWCWVQEGWVLLCLLQEDLCQVFGFFLVMKYEFDGGLGIVVIMIFLLGLSEVLKDCYDFMKFMVFQWLMGVMDGYVKNFLIYLLFGGSYCLILFYDIILVFLVLGGMGLYLCDLKLLMGFNVIKGCKIEINVIYLCYFLVMVKVVNFFWEQMLVIFQEFVGYVLQVIESVCWMLLVDFFSYVWQVIIENMLKLYVCLQ